MDGASFPGKAKYHSDSKKRRNYEKRRHPKRNWKLETC